MNTEALDAATKAVKEAFHRYSVVGTSCDDLHSPPYRAPWSLIDTYTADEDVGWPGKLVRAYDNPQAAYDHRERLAAKAAVEAFLAAFPDEGGLADEARREAEVMRKGISVPHETVVLLDRLAEAVETMRAELVAGHDEEPRLLAQEISVP